MTLRERVLQCADDMTHDPIMLRVYEMLALNVARIVAEECARECDNSDACDPKYIADRIRTLAEGL